MKKKLTKKRKEKYLKIALIITSLCFVICAFLYMSVNSNYNKIKNEQNNIEYIFLKPIDYKFLIMSIGIDIENDPVTQIITSTEELQNFKKDYFNFQTTLDSDVIYKYNQTPLSDYDVESDYYNSDYFSDKNLIITMLPSGSSSFIYTDKHFGLNTDSNKYEMYIDLETPELITSDNAYKTVLLEVSKAEIITLNNFDVIIHSQQNITKTNTF